LFNTAVVLNNVQDKKINFKEWDDEKSDDEQYSPNNRDNDIFLTEKIDFKENNTNNIFAEKTQENIDTFKTKPKLAVQNTPKLDEKNKIIPLKTNSFNTKSDTQPKKNLWDEEDYDF